MLKEAHKQYLHMIKNKLTKEKKMLLSFARNVNLIKLTIVVDAIKLDKDLVLVHIHFVLNVPIVLKVLFKE